MSPSKKSRWMLAGVSAGAIAVASILYFTVIRGLLEGDASTASSAAAQSLKRYRVGQLEIGIATDPATPRVGQNRLIRLKHKIFESGLIQILDVFAHRRYTFLISTGIYLYTSIYRKSNRR